MSLNTVNFSFLVLGLLLHHSPAHYLQAVNEAIKGTSGIVLSMRELWG